MEQGSMITTSTNSVAESASESRSAISSAKHPRIAFFGIFGVQNLGNECTLQAILHNARERMPNADLYTISYRPEDTTARHKVNAVAISSQYSKENAPGEPVPRTGGIGRVFRVLFKRIPEEIRDWLRAIHILRGTSAMVMTGTGMLTDYATSASGYPYDVFKWSLAARLAGCKVRFVGIGVGPIYSPLSRWFIKRALSFSDFRGFRDAFSRNRIKNYGFNSERDHVFPDLAFSLPADLFAPKSRRARQKPVVGLGIMDHRDIHIATLEEQEAAYSAYLDKMCSFITWLIQNGFAVRILQGDARYDVHARRDLRERLEAKGIRYDEAGIIDEGCDSVDELLPQLADADFIVSPRFHNLLLGLMFDIPVLSISYDPKSDSLVDGFGLSNYRQTLSELDVPKLIQQFKLLTSNADQIRPNIRKVSSENRSLLDKEYQLIFGDL
jgi:polysaccharide pyruvyl transferase WcaK-like protein